LIGLVRAIAFFDDTVEFGDRFFLFTYLPPILETEVTYSDGKSAQFQTNRINLNLKIDRDYSKKERSGAIKS